MRLSNSLHVLLKPLISFFRPADNRLIASEILEITGTFYDFNIIYQSSDNPPMKIFQAIDISMFAGMNPLLRRAKFNCLKNY